MPFAFAIVETFLAFILAVSLHEAAHALMARVLGDATPASKGRLSLLPTRHMAAVGTIVAIVTSFSVQAGIGWGKPVDADVRRMRVGPNVGTILVALAGPLANLLLGIGVAFGLRFVPGYNKLAVFSDACGGVGGQFQACLSALSGQPGYLVRIEQFLIAFAVTSIVLALLNLLIPLYPLDLYHIIFAVLPTNQAIRYRNWIPYMELLLLVLFFVLPLLLSFFRIAFNPASLLAEGARAIVYSIAGPGAALYLRL